MSAQHYELNIQRYQNMSLCILRQGPWEAVINLTRGANCIALRHHGLGARILREPSYGEGEHPFLYGMPILFPVNRISGGRFVFEGREYRFPVNEPDTGCHLHGDLHAAPFEAIGGDGHQVICRYRADETHPYGAFPHAFEVRITYCLEEDGLAQITEVINHSETAMPCMLGFHTTFRIPFIDGGSVTVRADVGEEFSRGTDYLPTGETPPPDSAVREICNGSWDPLSAPLSRHLRAGESGIAELTDHLHGVRLLYENDAAWGFRLIYNGDASGFLCFEPQNCLVDAPNNVFGRARSGFVTIPPGEARLYRSRLRLVELP